MYNKLQNAIFNFIASITCPKKMTLMENIKDIQLKMKNLDFNIKTADVSFTVDNNAIDENTNPLDLHLSPGHAKMLDLTDPNSVASKLTSISSGCYTRDDGKYGVNRFNHWKVSPKIDSNFVDTNKYGVSVGGRNLKYITYKNKLKLVATDNTTEINMWGHIYKTKRQDKICQKLPEDKCNEKYDHHCAWFDSNGNQSTPNHTSSLMVGKKHQSQFEVATDSNECSAEYGVDYIIHDKNGDEVVPVCNTDWQGALIKYDSSVDKGCAKIGTASTFKQWIGGRYYTQSATASMDNMEDGTHSPEHCCFACKNVNDSSCKHWTFVKQPGAAKGTCYMKSRIDAKVNKRYDKPGSGWRQQNTYTSGTIHSGKSDWNPHLDANAATIAGAERAKQDSNECKNIIKNNHNILFSLSNVKDSVPANDNDLFFLDNKTLKSQINRGINDHVKRHQAYLNCLQSKNTYNSWYGSIKKQNPGLSDTWVQSTWGATISIDQEIKDNLHTPYYTIKGLTDVDVSGVFKGKSNTPWDKFSHRAPFRLPPEAPAI